MCFPPPHPVCEEHPHILPTLHKQINEPGLLVNGVQILGLTPRGRSCIPTAMLKGRCVVRERGHGGTNNLAGVLFYFKVVCPFLECKHAM